MKIIVVTGMVLGLLLSNYGFAQSDRSEEISQLITGIESTSSARRIHSAKIITRSGIQDQTLYQKVAELLKTGYPQDKSKDHTDEMSWMCKALAASGNPEYKGLLDEIAEKAPSAKLRNYAEESSELINQYAQRIKILNATDSWDESLSEKENRLVIMLESADIGMRREAAKIIVRHISFNDKVYAVTATTLSEMAKEFNPSTLNIDTMAWLCKALATSGDSKYIEVLEQIADNAQNAKLRSYASKALKTLK